MREASNGKRGYSADWAPSPEEYERLRDACQDERDRVCLMVLAEGGFRARELTRIRESWLGEDYVAIPDVDPDTGWKPKTRAAVRRVPLKWMDRYASDLLEDYLAAHGGSMDFCYGTLWNRVKGLGYRAGLYVYPHALRAFCATKWSHRIPNVFDLMDLMGWSTVGVALRYIRRTGKRARDAVLAWRMANPGV